jgi:hypothetical protein
MKLLVTVCVVASLSCAAAALDVTAKKQDAQKPAKQEQAAKPDASAATKPDPNADRPKPSAEMKKLAHLIGGRWQVEEKFEISPFTPQGGEGKGTEIVHRGPGGLSLILNYSSTGTMGEAHGNGIVTWSPAEGVFQQFWVDNGQPGGELWQGKWQNDSLVFAREQKMGEQTMHFRQTLNSFSEGSFNVTLEMGASDAEMKRFMTFKFTRMAKQSAGIRRRGTGMHGRPTNDNWGGPRAEMGAGPGF